MSEIEEANPDVPYRAEYAKSGRASCRGCKESIEKGTLRLAVLVQSPMFDGKMPMWYHYMCFFSKQHPKAVGDIAHFEELQFEDQEKIRKQIAKFGADGASSSTTNGDAKKAKKRPKAAVKKDLKNVFVIEYAKSSRAHCRGCEEKIVKGEIRVSKKDFESDEGRRFGGMDRWHHLVCFGKMRAELVFYHCGDTLPGFEDLNKEDKATVKKALPEIKPVEGSDAVDGEAPAKKVKLEKGDDEETKKKEKEDKKKLKKQSDDLFKMKDMVKDLKKVVKSQILEYNEQEIPVGEDRILERLVDCMTFGKLLPCEKCKTGQFVFRSGVGYQCTGSVSEWVKCEYVYVNPPRVPFKIPEEIIEKIAESKEKKIADISKKLAKYKCSVHDRIIQFNEKTVPVKKEEEASGSKENAGPKLKLDRKLPFKGMDFFIYKFTKERKDLKIAIERLGGSVASTLHDEIAAVISTEEEVEKCHSKIQDAKDLGIQVVSVDFIEKCKNLDDAVDKIVEYSISPWGDDPKKRVDKSRQNKSEMKSMKYGKSIYEKSGKSSKVKYKVESGTAVEPESGLVDIAHVYKSGSDIYTVTLGLTDIQTNKNSFYKLQLLESNSSNKKYWLFRAWGRIGTNVGGTKVDSFNSDLSEAKKLFCIQYEDKTGNLWCNHKNFQKIPGKMYPLSVDYGESSDTQVEKLDATNSKLKKPVQDLIMMIFNLDLMKKTMIEFEINLDEMPLGRISKSQMKEAYLVLTELQNFINQKGEDIKPNQKQLILEATNRFYTFVPHNFGIKAPPLLDNLDIIKQKIEMLDSLLEMEFAYEVMQSSQKGGEHTLDAHYAKLNADIDVVEPDCKEFEIIQNYVKNTHAETHSNYELEILDAFKINRKEEEKRFKPFKKLPNRKLLWHGSRLTNFAGILSQGLRIAPPEAPVTGYMFGKGLYFADMVSKSANYCMTSPNNNVGLLLLCDVALGTMYERPHADYIEKLPSGFHSTKGLGHTSPDPKQCATLDDGVEVPFGKPVKSAKKNTSLLYNEYIVYDVAQVKAKYLVKMEFKYKY